MSKREVWVLELDGKPTDIESAEEAAEAAEAALSPPLTLARYVPAAELVDGWPTEDGWYWAIAGCMGEIVRIHEGMLLAVGKLLPFERETVDPLTQFYGPIQPPYSVEPKPMPEDVRRAVEKLREKLNEKAPGECVSS